MDNQRTSGEIGGRVDEGKTHTGSGVAEIAGLTNRKGFKAAQTPKAALEHSQEMAAHESPRTTELYDRTKQRLTQDLDRKYHRD